MMKGLMMLAATAASASAAASSSAAGSCAIDMTKFGGLRYTMWSVNSADLNDRADRQIRGGGDWTSGLGHDLYDLEPGCYGVESFTTLGKDGPGSDPTETYYNVTSPDGCMNPTVVGGNGFSSAYFAVGGAFCMLPSCYSTCWSKTKSASTDFCANYASLLADGACTSCSGLAGQRRQMQLRCLNQGCSAASDCMVTPSDVSTVYELDVSILVNHTRIGSPTYDYALKRLVEIAVAKAAGVPSDDVSMTYINGNPTVNVVADTTTTQLRGATPDEDPWTSFQFAMNFGTQKEADDAAATLKANMDKLTTYLQELSKVGMGDAVVAQITTTVTQSSMLPTISPDSADGNWPAENYDSASSPSWLTTPAPTPAPISADSTCDPAKDKNCTCKEVNSQKKCTNTAGSSDSSSSGGLNTMTIAGIAIGCGLGAALLAGVGYSRMKKRRARAAALKSASKARGTSSAPAVLH